ncbi:phosphoribosylanthranilate isomerase [Ketogulonicigenium robustum]|uniref:N-(5'-phosphoribosyl)anthranilate isomerase n=1 Tax=Ketogulonicigenium robustum TaxID=92947 RepID=A0A1W6NXA5_9RHOB|nr:phosphoribosylanthranilate isomerase [Ketogulonicigenium robustum]ARO13878.1 phosphoribosylanthranilate isomerase [Ketogulonicigenium robustum]
MRPLVKICGLRTDADLQSVADAGAHYGGLVFFPKSPRAVDLDTAAALRAPDALKLVALVVDADDALLDAIIARIGVQMLQLHGHETPERVAAVRQRYGLPIMKAISVATRDDLPAIATYEAVADQILLDAKAPKGAILPGGNGVAFDWTLLQGRVWSKPWMLAGGLTPENVAEGMRLTGAAQVDVSSGVESAPGVKDPALIRAFAAAAGL